MIDQLNRFSVTDREPDNSYFEGQVTSYEGTVDSPEGELRATLGTVQPGFKGQFPVADGGEDITLAENANDGGLAIEVIDGQGNVEQSHVLTREGDRLSAAAGKTMKISTSGAVVRYLCVYPGQPIQK
jgi:hypothetical protein